MEFSSKPKKEKKREWVEKHLNWQPKFALFPKRIDGDTIVWLETYYRKAYQYTHDTTPRIFNWSYKSQRQMKQSLAAELAK
jgi:hypothetical protein